MTSLQLLLGDILLFIEKFHIADTLFVIFIILCIRMDLRDNLRDKEL
jgi:hypothetical protein